MRLAGVLLLTLLGGCQADADTLEQAVSASLARQDYRLIVRAGSPAPRTPHAVVGSAAPTRAGPGK